MLDGSMKQAPKAATLIREFLRELEDLAYSPHTVKAYRRALEDYAELLARRHKSPCTALYDDVVGYRRSIEGSRATVRLRMSAVRSFHAWLAAAGYAVLDPARAVKVPRPRGDDHVRVTHSTGAIEALKAACGDPFDRATIALLYDCALRVSEAAELPSFMLRLDERRLTVIGKGRKRRELWIPDSAVEPLADWTRRTHGGAYVFPARRTNSVCPHVAPATINRRLRDVARTAALDTAAFNPHSLRHARAEHLRAQGVDVVTVSRILGHGSPQMTAHYMNPPTEQPIDG